MPGLLDKWWFWVTSVISVEIHSMRLHRRVWLDVQKMLSRNESLPASYWWVFMGDTYGVTQAFAVRRQVDTHRDAVSLRRLLMDISRHADLLSRKYFLSRFDPRDARKLSWAEGHWDSTYAGSIGRHLDPAIPRADLATMIAAAENVKEFVDLVVAHRGASALPTGPELMLSEVHRAIDAVSTTYRKYYGLITGHTRPKLTPSLPSNWREVFRHSWQAPDPR